MFRPLHSNSGSETLADPIGSNLDDPGDWQMDTNGYCPKGLTGTIDGWGILCGLIYLYVAFIDPIFTSSIYLPQTMFFSDSG